MRRVFALDVLRCHACGSRRRTIALITQPGVIRRILEHLGLPAARRAGPSAAPARAPLRLIPSRPQARTRPRVVASATRARLAACPEGASSALFGPRDRAGRPDRCSQSIMGS